MGVRFDSASAMAELRRNLVVAMKQLQQEYIDEVRSQMRDHEHADSWYAGDIDVLADKIVAQVVGGAWATIDTFGSGSELDRDNPWLQDYIGSEYWNTTRRKRGPDDLAIRSRPGGTKDMFGNVKDGKSKGGFNLEAAGKVEPQPPSHAPQNVAARWMSAGRMQEVIDQAVESTNFGKYFIETKE